MVNKDAVNVNIGEFLLREGILVGGKGGAPRPQTPQAAAQSHSDEHVT